MGAHAAVASTQVRITAQPRGDGGNWRLVFDDEFNGTRLNTRTWTPHDGWPDQNNVTTYAGNVKLSGGFATLTLASRYSGAEIATRHFRLRVGEFVQARIKFAGTRSVIYNWPAWWASGSNWPAAGENDIAEGFGSLTVNYHSPSGVHNHGSVRGQWGGTFHTYGLYRGPNFSTVYWDGKQVRRYPTDDNGQPQTLLLTVGLGRKNTMIGPAGAMVVDYVRAWAPA